MMASPGNKRVRLSGLNEDGEQQEQQDGAVDQPNISEVNQCKNALHPMVF